jgi:hypothetical protein
MKKIAAITFIILVLSAGAPAQTTNYSAKDSGKIITAQINKTFCTIITLITLVTAGIAALVIILAGVRYMTSEDPDEAGRSKTRIVYAIVGMILVLLACPMIDYLVTGTNITPFSESCKCIVGGGGNTSTTIPGSNCTDGTLVGQCSTKTAIGSSGAKCVSNAGNPSLIPDANCAVPTTTTTIATTTLATTTTITPPSSTTSSSTTSSTTTTTLLCATADCPDPVNTCQVAYEFGRCNDFGGFDGLDTICGAGYKDCCCTNYLNGYGGTALYTACCGG